MLRIVYGYVSPLDGQMKMEETTVFCQTPAMALKMYASVTSPDILINLKWMCIQAPTLINGQVHWMNYMGAEELISGFISVADNFKIVAENPK